MTRPTTPRSPLAMPGTPERTATRTLALSNGRRVAAALVLTGLMLGAPVFAGCLSSSDESKQDVTPNKNDTGPKTVDGKVEAPDGRGNLAAFNETNQTVSGRYSMEHRHDYWQGQDTYTVMQQEWTFIPLPLQPKTGEPAGTAIADLIPDTGKLVPEGTSQLEITLKVKGFYYHVCSVRGVPLPAGCTPDSGNPTAHMAMKYITASDNLGEWRTGGDLEDGKTLIIPVEALQTDMPHSTASLWIFRVFSKEPNSVYFNITVTARKGAAVANWPGHPDFYAKGPSRTVYDSDITLKFGGYKTWNIYGDDSNWVVPEKLVSWGTTRLEVYVTVASVKINDPEMEPAISGWHLDYHNATDQPRIQTGDISMQSAYDANATDGKTYHFTVTTDDASFDSPYATVSRWGFRLLPDTKAGGCTEQCPAYEVQAHFKVEAWDDAKLKGEIENFDNKQ